MAQERPEHCDAAKYNYISVAKCLNNRDFHLTTPKHVMSQKSAGNTPGRVQIFPKWVKIQEQQVLSFINIQTAKLSSKKSIAEIDSPKDVWFCSWGLLNLKIK